MNSIDMSENLQGGILMDNLFNPDELANVLEEFNSSNEAETEEMLSSNMSKEMQASQMRYEEYIKKHENDN